MSASPPYSSPGSESRKLNLSALGQRELEETSQALLQICWGEQLAQSCLSVQVQGAQALLMLGWQ